MEENAARGFITRSRFNTGDEIDVKQNDVVILVGPNNAGKSQSLSDIYELLYNEKNSTIVVSGVTLSKAGSLKNLLDKLSKKTDNGNYTSYSIPILMMKSIIK